MARSDRLRWVDRGSPFRLMTPARDLRDVLRRHGYTVYDIGNQSHLEHEPPEDHTPYSETAYPGTSVYGVGYAIDIMPPAAGARSKVDGLPLPSLQKLGAQLVADRNAGVAGIKWLKYINWEPTRDNGGPCYQDSWKPTYVRRSSTDRGHIHMSGLTGFESSTIGAGYDPVARIRGGDDDMTPDQDKRLKRIEQALFGTTGDGNYAFAIRDEDGKLGPREPLVQRLADQAYATVGGPGGSGAYIARVLPRMEATLAQVAGRDLVDEPAIVAGVLAALTPEKIADAIPPTVAKQVADILAARLAS